MPAPPFLAKMPRPALFALTGALAALLAALTAGELVWYLLRPSPPKPIAPAPRDEPPAEALTASPPLPTGPSLAVTAGPVTVYPGGKNTFGVRVLRDGFDGPVKVRFDTPTVLSAAEVTIPAGETGGTAEVVAPPDMKPGTVTLTATATAEDRPVTATAAVRVTVSVPPPPPARLAVSAAPKVQAYQKGKNTFAVRVARADFDGPVVVTFTDLPDDVKISAVTVPADKTEAVAELTAGAAAKSGSARVTVTARAVPKGVATTATAEVFAEVLDPSKVPVDVVLALDCTGSMRNSVNGLSEHWPALVGELNRGRFDVRFGVVGFRDTTLGQRLEEPEVGGELMSPDAERFVAVVRRLRLGGGGGEGESSLDGIARAAEYPLREGAARVIVLVTDGPPKRSDGKMKSTEMAVKHLGARRIDQLHVVALSEHRKRFESLWEGAKGKFFDLKAANAENTFAGLMTDLGKAIAEAVVPPVDPKPEPAPTAPLAVLPEPSPTAPPIPPASREPDEPRFPPLVLPPPSAPSVPAPVPAAESPAAAKVRSLVAVGAWALTVVSLACAALFVSQRTFLGDQPTFAAGAVGYGGGLTLGLAAGAAGYATFDAIGVPLLARLCGACLFGLSAGMAVAFAERLFPVKALALEEPAAPPSRPLPPPKPQPLDLPPVEAPPVRERLPELDLPPVEAYPSPPLPRPLAPVKLSPPSPHIVPAHKPNITAAPKPGDGCPGCGRKIPGEVGSRYCMVCDQTF